MIDRTCALAGAEYEWGVHASAFGGAAGPGRAPPAGDRAGGSREDCWDAEEAAVLRLAEELHETSTIGDGAVGAS